VLDIEDMQYTDLKDARNQLAEREKEMETAALYTLQHHAIRHSIRLFFAAIGFKIPAPEIEPDYADIEEGEEPATA
jgi:hypothetical protein